MEKTFEQRRQALEAEIQAIYAQERAEIEAKRAAFRFKVQVTFAPAESHRLAFGEKMRPDSGVVIYTLTAKTLNAKEASEAGFKAEDLFNGSMSYYVNVSMPQPRIVCSTGGGLTIITTVYTMYLGDKESQRIVTEDSEKIFNDLEDFLRKNPLGGDVTAILLQQRKGYLARKVFGE